MITAKFFTKKQSTTASCKMLTPLPPADSCDSPSVACGALAKPAFAPNVSSGWWMIAPFAPPRAGKSARRWSKVPESCQARRTCGARVVEVV